MTYLLDVNILIALLDTKHIYHKKTEDWFFDIASKSWATCPITENGFLRIVTSPAYANVDASFKEALTRLNDLTKIGNHVFWEDEISFSSSKDLLPQYVIKSKEITDIYLILLAKKNKGKLATLDKKIRGDAITDGKNSVELF